LSRFISHIGADRSLELMALVGCVVLLLALVLYLSWRLARLQDRVSGQHLTLLENGERLDEIESFQRSIDPARIQKRDEDLVGLLESLLAATQPLRPNGSPGETHNFEMSPLSVREKEGSL